MSAVWWRLVAAPFLASPRMLLAKDPYVQFSAFDYSTLKWAGAIVALAGIAAILAKMIPRFTLQIVGQKPTLKTGRNRANQNRFKARAQAMGFRMKESKILIQIAAKVAPHKPETMLGSNGREYLYKDLEKRVRTREREIAVLRDVQRKLENMRGRHIQERESNRVESNIPVWVVKKLGRSATDSLEEPEGINPDLRPNQGRLLDISEGGAAVVVDVPADPGDLVDFWSGDPNILLSPITAVVVQVKHDPDHDSPIRHLHFLDPPESELRAALYEIELRNA